MIGCAEVGDEDFGGFAIGLHPAGDAAVANEALGEFVVCFSELTEVLSEEPKADAGTTSEVEKII